MDKKFDLAFINRHKTYILLGLIVVAGIFLRTYHFHDWLYFYPDQARDVKNVGDYLNGKIPLPLIGFRAASTFFDLGAMYYYFQIISGKLFGVAPETMAYPDLFFNILAIPLLYYFLKSYFKTDISLILTAVYAVSYYAVEYSRFAWNPNPMPFFVLLYLLSLWKFLSEREKTHWGWILGLGVAIGVGIQLHTILIFLLTSVTLVAFIVSIKGNWRLWNRWLAVIAVIMLLNTNQIISETSHHFSNTKRLFRLSAGSSESSGKAGKVYDIALDAVCHVQANAHIISSLGNKTECDYLIIASNIYRQKLLGIPVDMKKISGMLAGLLFSIFGYGLLIYFYRSEKDQKKKTFLGLICLYIGLSFLIIYPVILDAPLRYYLQLFFVPYFFLGFILEFVRRKWAKIFTPTLFAALLLLVGFNFSTLFSEAKLYATNNHSQPQYVVLGELDHMRDYIISQTNYQKNIYMLADGKYMQNYFYPLSYVLQEKSIVLWRELKNSDNIPSDVPLFFVGKKVVGNQVDSTKGFPIRQYRNFGEIGIYILDNQRQSQTKANANTINNN
jgi:hypothetical protein